MLELLQTEVHGLQEGFEEAMRRREERMREESLDDFKRSKEEATASTLMRGALRKRDPLIFAASSLLQKSAMGGHKVKGLGLGLVLGLGFAAPRPHPPPPPSLPSLQPRLVTIKVSSGANLLAAGSSPAAQAAKRKPQKNVCRRRTAPHSPPSLLSRPSLSPIALPSRPSLRSFLALAAAVPTPLRFPRHPLPSPPSSLATLFPRHPLPSPHVSPAECNFEVLRRATSAYAPSGRGRHTRKTKTPAPQDALATTADNRGSAE
jgi:hypothetical protein